MTRTTQPSFWRNIFKEPVTLHISYDPVHDETTALISCQQVKLKLWHIGEPDTTPVKAEEKLQEWCQQNRTKRERLSEFTIQEHRTRAEYDSALQEETLNQADTHPILTKHPLP